MVLHQLGFYRDIQVMHSTMVCVTVRSCAKLHKCRLDWIKSSPRVLWRYLQGLYGGSAWALQRLDRGFTGASEGPYIVWRGSMWYVPVPWVAAWTRWPAWCRAPCGRWVPPPWCPPAPPPHAPSGPPTGASCRRKKIIIYFMHMMS